MENLTLKCCENTEVPGSKFVDLMEARVIVCLEKTVKESLQI